MRRRASLLLAAVVLVAAGCARQEEPQAPKEQAWRAKGQVVSLAEDGKRVRIDHQDIPGLMGAMTMDFRVDDPKAVEGFEEGDPVEFKLVETPRGLTVTEMRKIEAVELEKTEIGKAYTGEGRVKVVNRMAAAVILEHEGIPGEMGAGELALQVNPPSLLEGIEDGMPVEFTLTRTEQGLVITDLKRRE